MFVTDFSGYTTTVAPSDWTERWNTANFSTTVEDNAGNQYLKFQITTASRLALSWNPANSVKDGEVLVKIKPVGRDSAATALNLARVYMRGSGAAASENAYFATLDRDLDGIGINKYVAGVSTAIASASFAFSLGSWYWIRFRCVGTSLKARIWADGNTEPSTWHVDTTDSSLTSAGWTGVGGFDAADDTEVDSISIEDLSSQCALPLLTVAATGYTEAVGTASLSLPLLTLTAAQAAEATGNRIWIPPRLVVEGAGNQGLPVPASIDVAGVGVTGTVGEGAIDLPLLELAGADEGIALPALEVAGSGVSGGWVGTAELELPVITLSGSGAQAQVGVASIELPVFALAGAGSSPRPAVDTSAGEPGADTGKQLSQGEALALHLTTNGLTTYDSYAFNAFAHFNGVVLAAGADGIYVVGDADDDADAAIQAQVRGAVTDFDERRLKRCAQAFVAYTTQGECVLRVAVDGGEFYEYPLEFRDVAGEHATRVKLGKGLKGRYWQIEFANVNGADFELDAIELDPQALSRRIGA